MGYRGVNGDKIEEDRWIEWVEHSPGKICSLILLDIHIILGILVMFWEKNKSAIFEQL